MQMRPPVHIPLLQILPHRDRMILNGRVFLIRHRNSSNSNNNRRGNGRGFFKCGLVYQIEKVEAFIKTRLIVLRLLLSYTFVH